MEQALTERQAKIMRCIRDHIADEGEGLSIRQIGQRVGLTSSSSVAYQLGRLEERGLLSRSGRLWRNCHMR
ncbi:MULTISPECIES: MarR family transcriptional regulator [unclassified Streptomyces]|uniref:LexA family protein n=1 Tax=unclassified Streptomyces TaxID=2593676 RepID=UPI003322E68E